MMINIKSNKTKYKEFTPTLQHLIFDNIFKRRDTKICFNFRSLVTIF